MWYVDDYTCLASSVNFIAYTDGMDESQEYEFQNDECYSVIKDYNLNRVDAHHPVKGHTQLFWSPEKWLDATTDKDMTLLFNLLMKEYPCQPETN